MLTAISSIRTRLALAAVILSSSLFLASCLKDHDSNQVNTPVAGLMAFNLSPDQSAAGFAISGSYLTNVPLAYTNYTGNYLSVYTGARSVAAFEYQGQRVLAETPGNFEEGKYYSAFLVGADSSYRTVLANDDLDTLSGTSGQAFVRYVNAITDSVNAPNVKVTVGGADVVNRAATYATVSDFVPVAPGDITVAVSGQNGVSATRTFAVEARKVYTVLLVGEPGNLAAPVEIKYITNGELSADAARTPSNSGRSVVTQ